MRMCRAPFGVHDGDAVELGKKEPKKRARKKTCLRGKDIDAFRARPCKFPPKSEGVRNRKASLQKRRVPRRHAAHRYSAHCGRFRRAPRIAGDNRNRMPVSGESLSEQAAAFGVTAAIRGIECRANDYPHTPVIRRYL